MAINPRKIKKKVVPRPARDLKSNDPKDLRNKALREANRAANENKPKATKPTPAKDLRSTDPKDLRNKALREANRIASERAKSAKLPTPKTSAGSSLAKGVLKKVPVIGTAAGFIVDAAPAGEGSDKPSGPLMKGNNMKPTFPKGKVDPRDYSNIYGGAGRAPLKFGGVVGGGGIPGYSTSRNPSYRAPGSAAQPKKASSFGPRISEGAKFERLRASRAALDKGKTSGDAQFPKGKGTASLPKVKSSTATTAATAAAASSSTTGKTTGKSTTVVKERVGLQSRYQRDALAMETRNKSGNKTKKSILSLFRKG